MRFVPASQHHPVFYAQFLYGLPLHIVDKLKITPAEGASFTRYN
jgi:hypothetical protein